MGADKKAAGARPRLFGITLFWRSVVQALFFFDQKARIRGRAGVILETFMSPSIMAMRMRSI